jgi:hypothetical protein
MDINTTPAWITAAAATIAALTDNSAAILVAVAAVMSAIAQLLQVLAAHQRKQLQDRSDAVANSHERNSPDSEHRRA